MALTLFRSVPSLCPLSVAGDERSVTCLLLRPGTSGPTDDDDGCAGHQREQGEQRLLVGVDEAGQGAPRPRRRTWTGSCSQHRGDKNQRLLNVHLLLPERNKKNNNKKTLKSKQ